MQYAMLVHLNENEFFALSKEEQNRVHRACTEWHENLLKAGKSIGATGLQPSATAKTLRFMNGKPNVMDGPYAETKEIIAGIEIFEFDSMDEAVNTLGTFPGLSCGTAIEIRPLVPGGKCEAI
ncbi:MAG TPA: YciI family protein [Verrucomicrobiae bacterium]